MVVFCGEDNTSNTQSGYSVGERRADTGDVSVVLCAAFARQQGKEIQNNLLLEWNWDQILSATKKKKGIAVILVNVHSYDLLPR